ncbi:unnamed protein product [Miscanthus lutarioriparius]|uniref:GIL1/IRKI C-terminal domain-containing protein n=1 Tax=Miscanthus lutarioriparius TaxID=422564 RepID=A0A811QFP1_9POAL|nr:unnamed protein product [Miscanthus lutarioriparius]
MAVSVAMLHKFALAFKTKTIEFLDEEEEDEDADRFTRRAAAPGGWGPCRAAVGIFQVGRGTKFSMVYMENIVRSKGFVASKELGKPVRPKVGFMVVPGFRLGGTVIQCRVYLDHGKREEDIIDSI